MALRVGGFQPPIEEQAAPVEEQVMPEQEMPAEEPMPEEEAPMQDMQGPTTLLNPLVAGYRDPQEGPFQCANCVYFQSHGPNTCSFVDGFIDPDGMCNLFTGQRPEEGDEEMPEEEAPMEEAPAEEVPEEQSEEEPAE